MVVTLEELHGSIHALGVLLTYVRRSDPNSALDTAAVDNAMKALVQCVHVTDGRIVASALPAIASVAREGHVYLELSSADATNVYTRESLVKTLIDLSKGKDRKEHKLGELVRLPASLQMLEF